MNLGGENGLDRQLPRASPASIGTAQLSTRSASKNLRQMSAGRGKLSHFVRDADFVAELDRHRQQRVRPVRNRTRNKSKSGRHHHETRFYGKADWMDTQAARKQSRRGRRSLWQLDGERELHFAVRVPITTTHKHAHISKIAEDCRRRALR